MTGGLFLLCVLLVAFVGAFVGVLVAFWTAWNWPLNRWPLKSGILGKLL